MATIDPDQAMHGLPLPGHGEARNPGKPDFLCSKVDIMGHLIFPDLPPDTLRQAEAIRSPP
jgi:hypothetical protein